MRFKLNIDTLNAAMCDDYRYELWKALRTVTIDIANGETGSGIVDTNGNHIGGWSLSFPEDD